MGVKYPEIIADICMMPISAWAELRLLIAERERCGSWMRMARENVSSYVDDVLIAFMELQTAIHAFAVGLMLEMRS
jgi:hypothetical protein